MVVHPLMDRPLVRFSGEKEADVQTTRIHDFGGKESKMMGILACTMLLEKALGV